MAENEDWTRAETLVAFRVYNSLPFGKLHKTNPLIVRVAKELGRSASSLGMKACNFASVDPQHARRNVKGLQNASTLVKTISEEFEADPEVTSVLAEAAFRKTMARAPLEHDVPGEEFQLPKGPTETLRTVKVRLAQSFFRRSVRAAYRWSCAITGLAVPELLTASHIIPWSHQRGAAKRADPRNGLLLNALLDRAFDRGLITFDRRLRLKVGRLLRRQRAQAGVLLKLEGRPLIRPERAPPDLEALEYHRDVVFARAESRRP